jgi:hypothetical protein
LAVTKVAISLNALAHIVNFGLAWILLDLLLLLLNWLLDSLVGIASHHSSYSLVGNFRSSSESHTLHNGTTKSTEHAWLLGSLGLHRWLSIGLLGGLWLGSGE